MVTVFGARRNSAQFAILLAGVAAAGIASPAAAQVDTSAPAASAPVTTAQATPAERPADTGDIVVTARRTEERLQDVPISVSAFGATALAERRIQSESDLQISTPGLTVRQTGSSDQLNYAIRGQSIDAFSFASPAVTAYFNEVQVGGVAATSFFDLASIQVLKGPQGTLFGRNATGGAVLYATQKPSLAGIEGYARAAYGNYNNRELEGAINVPLGESFALRVAGKYRKRDGFQHDLLNDTHPNSIDSKNARVSLLIAPPGSKFQNITVGQLGWYDGRTGAVKIQNANGVNGSPATYFDPITGTTQPLVTNTRDAYGPGVIVTDPRVSALFSGIGDFLTKQQNVGFYDVYINADQKRIGRQRLITNTTTYDVSDEATIKNIFGYNRVHSFERSDIDGSPYDFLRVGGGAVLKDQGYTFNTNQFSDELNVSGKTGALTYIVGAFYSKEKTYTRIPLRVTGDLGAPFLGPYAFTVNDRSKALYAQLSYALTDRLNVTGGFRYTWEDVSIHQAADSLLFTVDGKRKDSKPSWLGSIDYKITDSLLVYFNQRGSWRTGGFNGTSAADFPNASTFKPETTYDFELGAKFAGDLGSVPARLNIAVYDQYIKKVQRAPYLNISALAGNVNKARVTGVELDASVDPAPWLKLGGAFTYTNARYTDPRATVAGANFIFGPYGDSPKYSGSAYFRASHDLDGDNGELALRGELYAQSKFYYSNLAATIVPNVLIKGYALVNARLEWNGILKSKINAALYGSNLTNKHYEAGGFPLGAVTGSEGTLPGTPRMYGIEVGIKF